MLPKQKAIARPQATVDSDSKCPLSRMVTRPIADAASIVDASASARPSQGD